MLKNILIKTTDHCNMRCNICGQNLRGERISPRSIDIIALQNFLDVLVKGTNICLWGGEPLLYADLLTLIHYCNKSDCMIGIITNGYYLNKFTDKLLHYNLNYITISIDGPESIHNYIRGIEKAFSKVKENCLEFIKRKSKFQSSCHVNVNYTIQAENIDHMYEFVGIVKDWGCNSITFNFPMLVDLDLGNSFMQLGKQMFNKEFISWKGYVNLRKDMNYKKLCDICNRIIVDYKDFSVGWSNIDFEFTEENVYRYFYKTDEFVNKKIMNRYCRLAEDTLSINANGDILLCPDYTDTIIGSIYHSSLSTYTNNKKNEILDNISILPMCYRCCHRA